MALESDWNSFNRWYRVTWDAHKHGHKYVLSAFVLSWDTFFETVCACTGGSSHRSLIGVDEEDLDDDLKLSPARLCNLIWRLGHHWREERHSELYACVMYYQFFFLL